MRIKKFWAKGYRSLRDVTLDGLGTFNVFYGPNGSGKSNLLAGMRALFQLAGEVGWQHVDREVDPYVTVAVVQSPLVSEQVRAISPRDFDLGSPSGKIVLGARLEAGSRPLGLALDNIEAANVTIEVTVSGAHAPRAHLSRFDVNDVQLLQIPLRHAGLAEVFLERLRREAFGLVDAIRSLHRELDHDEKRADVGLLLEDELNAGRLASALFAAKNASSSLLRRRFRTLQSLLESEPLHRPPFDVFRDVATREITVREMFSSSRDEEREVPLDLAGLGVVQLYSILAKILFSGAHVVAVEEPEAHLHAPTSGLHLRQLLQRLVEEEHVDQLMIATHSNLFDLDPAGYWDVSLVDGATVVERKPLDEIDARHLYEPGPAKHALQQLLRYAPEDEVVFRRPDGSPVSAGEMLRLLQEDAPIAVDFLRNLHGAALRVLRLNQRRGAAT